MECHQPGLSLLSMPSVNGNISITQKSQHHSKQVGFSWHRKPVIESMLRLAWDKPLKQQFPFSWESFLLSIKSTWRTAWKHLGKETLASRALAYHVTIESFFLLDWGVNPYLSRGKGRWILFLSWVVLMSYFFNLMWLVSRGISTHISISCGKHRNKNFKHIENLYL